MIVRIFLKRLPVILLLLLLLLLVVVVYFSLFNAFFQQDEWAAFGDFYAIYDKSLINLFATSFAPDVGHYAPLYDIVFRFFFNIFGLNFQYWMGFSLIWHIVTIVAVYILALRIFKSNLWAFISSLFFGLNVSGFQATSWTVADINTHGATFFGVLSLIFFWDLLDIKKRDSKKYLLLHLTFLFISLGFKESAVGLFILLPIIYNLFNKGISVVNKYTIYIIISGLFYIGLRILMFLLPNVSNSPVLFESQSLSAFIYNLLTFPAKALSQTIIPLWVIQLIEKILPDTLINYLGLSRGSVDYNIFVEQKIFELMFVLFFMFVIGRIFIFYKHRSTGYKVIIFSFLFIVINSFIYAFSPAREGIITFIDSRNLYFISIGSMVFLTALASYSSFKKRALVFFILILLLVLNLIGLKEEIKNQVDVGIERHKILGQIKSYYPAIPVKTVFYTESNSSFYGLPDLEKIMPFQSGFGQTLLVWYQKTEKFPVEFFHNYFLWEIESQGYKEKGGRGFGYFRDFNLMIDTMEKEGVFGDSVIAFRYDSESKTLEDITEEIQGRIRGFKSLKRLLSSNNLHFNASQNPEQIYLAVDGNRKTKWDSKLEYIYPQFMEIDLKKLRSIGQIRIDSYDNKDQNNVGYRILVSGDAKNWNEVFYSKYYPPNSDGIVDIYFEPQFTRYIKIEQIGKHGFASWVIHELYLYEAVK